jgi:hypothetical protein
MEFLVTITAKAFVTTKVTVKAADEAAARLSAEKLTVVGDVEWTYDGLLEEDSYAIDSVVPIADPRNRTNANGKDHAKQVADAKRRKSVG